MRAILWFLLGLIVALSGQSFAEGWVDGYGNTTTVSPGYYSTPGQSNYRDSKGTLHYAPPPVPSLNRPC